mmetsp:Transcript_40872/g.64852  ORF Transcript_40872/g.64852 Transcript_40872/m.64852 type:complete len:211 (+) Transcript_40872:47-679(+)
MSAKENSRKIITFARQGKLDGDPGLRSMVLDAIKCQQDLDYNEKPYFRTALWEATWKNNEQIVKFLTDKGASVSYADYQGRTPLHEAAYYGHINLVEYFLDKGAPIDVTDIFGQSALYRAIEGGRHDIVEVLVRRKAETNLLDTHDVNPHHVAAFAGMPQMANWLIYKGAWRNRFAVDEGTRAQEKAEANATAGESIEKADEEVDPDSKP